MKNLPNQRKPQPEDYYDRVLAFPHRRQTETALSLNTSGIRIAIDCGCGTGSDMAFLLENGYEVHGFDNHPKSIEVCSRRFSDNPKARVSESSFAEFCYPACGLVIANASLFFCAPGEFLAVWGKIVDAIELGGIFCGDFMGPNDSWLTDSCYTLTSLQEGEVKALFSGFEIVHFFENEWEGETAMGRTKHWHTFHVIARKK